MGIFPAYLQRVTSFARIAVSDPPSIVHACAEDLVDDPHRGHSPSPLRPPAGRCHRCHQFQRGRDACVDGHDQPGPGGLLRVDRGRSQGSESFDSLDFGLQLTLDDDSTFSVTWGAEFTPHNVSIL